MRQIIALAIAGLLPLSACDKKAAPAASTTVAANTAPATGSAATGSAAAAAPAANPTANANPGAAAVAPPAPPAEPAPNPNLPAEMAASHILYMFKGSMRAPATVTRTKEEAQKAAEAVLAKLKSGGKFEDLAKAESDCPSKARGGFLGVFPSKVMHPKFSEATMALADGALSGVVETPFGFHVIRRDKIEKVQASHILFAYKGAMRARPEVTRSKEEAQKSAAAVLAKIKTGGKFEDLAKAESDCPSKAKGGDLGSFGKGMMAPAFEQTAFALKVGDLSGVVETPFGFHVIKRTN